MTSILTALFWAGIPPMKTSVDIPSILQYAYMYIENFNCHINTLYVAGNYKLYQVNFTPSHKKQGGGGGGQQLKRL